MAFKYRAIRDQVLSAARKSPGDRLPSEAEICRSYGVSRNTAVKALNSLAEDDLVRREVGRGTFLKRDRVTIPLRFLIRPGTIPMAVIERFHAANPDVEVRLEEIDAGHLLREIVARPGLKVMCHSHVGFLHDLDLLQELDQLDGFAQTQSRLVEQAITWRRGADGARRCVSLPLMLYPEVLLYNQRMAGDLDLDAEQGPSDWSDFTAWASAAGRLRHGSHAVMGLGIQRDHMLPLSFLVTARDGRDFLQEDGNDLCFDFEHGREWLALFQDLHRSGAMPLHDSRQPNPLFFGTGFMAAWGNTWVINQQQHFQCPDPIAVRGIPPVSVGGARCSYIYKPELFLLRDDQAEPEERAAAWRLIRFLVEDVDAQRDIDAHFAGVSVNRILLEEQRQDARYQPFITAMEGGCIRNDHALKRAVMKIIGRYFYRCVLEDMTPSAAASAIDEACQMQLEIGDAHR